MRSRQSPEEEKKREARRVAFAEVFREAREAVVEPKYLSQEKLAAAADLDRTTISLIERGKQSPTIEAVWILCDEMNVSPSELLARAEKRLRKK